jgi:hypothetical protein
MVLMANMATNDRVLALSAPPARQTMTQSITRSAKKAEPLGVLLRPLPA